MKFRRREAVLEIGSGTGYYLVKIAEKIGEEGEAHGIDISRSMLEIARERLERGLSRQGGAVLWRRNISTLQKLCI